MATHSAIMDLTETSTIELFVDGAFVPASSGDYFQRLDPSTGLVASHVACGRKEDAEYMAAIAASSFSAWSNTHVTERAVILRRAATLMSQYQTRFADCMLKEIGAINDWVDFNINTATDTIEAAVSLALRYQDTTNNHERLDSYTLRQPAGICLAIAPWNAPVAL